MLVAAAVTGVLRRQQGSALGGGGGGGSQSPVPRVGQLRSYQGATYATVATAAEP